MRLSIRKDTIPPPREQPRQPRSSRSNPPTRIPTGNTVRGRRKRSYEESFALDKKAISSGQERGESSRRIRSSPFLEKEAAPIPTITSDSQATVSDPTLYSRTAKQANVSPIHSRARPFRLNLHKKSVSGSEAPPLLEVTPGSGSSAKKSLTFDSMIPASEKCREIEPGLPLRWAMDSKISAKSWYEQTLEEEEEEEGELAPLEARFSSLIKINEPCLEPIPMGDQETAIPVEVAPDQKSLRSPSPSVSEENLEEVEAFAKEWENNHSTDWDKVDLEWTEEDALAYRETTNVLTEIEDFMENDDLLGEELNEISAGKSADELGQNVPILPPIPDMGRPKPKSRKKREIRTQR